MPKPFKSVNAQVPRRSVFDLSYTKLMTADMGYLYPVMADEVVPGDKFKIGCDMVIRMAPLVSPVLHEINAYVHYFFVPYRLLWSEWETFISGGTDGNQTPVYPKWTTGVGDKAVGSLWDYLGFPAGVDPGDKQVSVFPARAYNFIYNNYYRDETFQAELSLTDLTAFILRRRNWTKDYFTSALPWVQRGTPPALPLSGTAFGSWSMNAAPTTGYGHIFEEGYQTPGHEVNVIDVGTGTLPDLYSAAGHTPSTYDLVADRTVGQHDLDNNIVAVDLSTASSFTISEIRLAFQIQKWMERNARSGVRYTEFLRSHFGVSPRDERLQRPEYIGGARAPLVISEVLQTSETNTTPQGTMAGHGITAVREYCGSYQVTEFGLIMGIFSIMPVPAYQDGVNKQWLRSTRFEHFFPEFSNLSEQAISKCEIFLDPAGTNDAVWGYQGRFDEMRYKPNQVCGLMRTDFAHWHLGRIFSVAPTLGSSFIQCVPDKRIFAVTNEPGFFVHFANRITAIRPIPAQAEPGLLDH